MAKQLIKEARRMQQLAGLINENYVDLMPINSPFMEAEEVNETSGVTNAQIQMKYFEMFGKNPQTKAEDVAKALNIDKDQVEMALQVGSKALTSMLKFESEEDDDMEDVESDEEEYDFTSPGKKDEFDAEDDTEPTAKDVKAGDALAKTAGGKQGKLDMLMKQLAAMLATYKQNVKGLDPGSAEYKAAIADYKNTIGDIPMQIRALQADLERDLSIDDEDEY